MDELVRYDQWLFYLINTEWTHPWLDVVLPWLRNKHFWIPVYFFIFCVFTLNFRRTGIYLTLLMVLTVTLTDQTSSALLKPLVNRLRPCQDPYLMEYVRTLIDCGVGKSFPSSHAANHFGISTFLAILFFNHSKGVTFVLFLWAFLVGYSQIYVGVHYPLDIIGGAVLGILLGGLTGWWGRKMLNKYNEVNG